MAAAEKTNNRGRVWVVPASRLIPGLDTGKSVAGIRDASFYSDDQLAQHPYPHSADTGYFSPSRMDTLWNSFASITPATKQEIQHRFSGYILVDIGSGGQLFGLNLANLLGARGYVAVEPHDYFRARHTIQSVSSPIPRALVAEDGLTFLQRLPNQSPVCFLLSNIHGLVIPNGQMRSAISREMKRTLSKTSAILLHKSDFFVGDHDLNTLWLLPDKAIDFRLLTLKGLIDQNAPRTFSLASARSQLKE